MLHVGVIGCGGMGRSHIDRLTNRTQGAEVVAVADMVDALVEKGAAIAGPNCKKYKSEKAAHEEKRKQKAAELEYRAYYHDRAERLSRIKKGASYANAQRRRFGL